jgi:hypothetical protein
MLHVLDTKFMRRAQVGKHVNKSEIYHYLYIQFLFTIPSSLSHHFIQQSIDQHYLFFTQRNWTHHHPSFVFHPPLLMLPTMVQINDAGSSHQVHALVVKEEMEMVLTMTTRMQMEALMHGGTGGTGEALGHGWQYPLSISNHPQPVLSHPFCNIGLWL